MSKFFYVYVPKNSLGNLRIGIDEGVWGWRTKALENSGGPNTPTNLEVAEGITVGDHIVFAAGGPGRRLMEEWVGVTLKRVLIARVVRPLYVSDKPVWPDDLYPHRIDVEFEEDKVNVPIATLGAAATEALQLSACRQCVALPGEAYLASVLDSPDMPSTDEENVLLINGPLDGEGYRPWRREQGRIRTRKFRKAPWLTCDFCGRTYPQSVVVAAHVKRRSDASYVERLDLNNIAAACLMGCDVLFELGYIHVDYNGHIQRTVEDMGDLDEPAKLLNGRVCTAFNARSRHYFAEHARRAVTAWPEVPLSRLDLSWPKYPWDTDLTHPDLRAG